MGRLVIIIEGMDNSGKSTLARCIAQRLNFAIQESEGPPRSREEINARIRRYAYMRNVVFVRHPVISNAIYGAQRPEGDPIDPALRRKFYSDPHNLFIYCDPLERGLDDHVVKDHDTPEHLALLEERRSILLKEYRSWAIRHAHFMYRIGDDMERVCDWVAHAACP